VLYDGGPVSYLPPPLWRGIRIPPPQCPLRADTRRSAAGLVRPQSRPFLPPGLGPLSVQLTRPRPRPATVRNPSTPAVGGLPLEGQESPEAVDPMSRLGFDASCH
jgi:hypothetical protein